MKPIVLAITALTLTTSAFGQKIMSEQVSYFDVRMPNKSFDDSVNEYNVFVETTYTLTVEELEAQSLEDFEKEKANYATVLKESKLEFEELLKNHDNEVVQAERRYDKEMDDFKSLSLLERLALTEQGKKPQLVVPSKPKYVQPREPQYVKPNISDYLIFDDQVLADGIHLNGFQKGVNGVTIRINISKMAFQDNGGQTYYNQPTNLKIMKGNEVIEEKVFDEDFQLLTTSSSNTIDLNRYEKSNVNKTMRNIEDYINQEYGYTPIASSIVIEYPKNKNREYDALENAKIKAISAYRKLKEDASIDMRYRSRAELEDARAIWTEELVKVDYKNKKADMNKEIAKVIFFNLMRVDISLKDKTLADETLASMQERRIDLDLNYNDEKVFTNLEEQVYLLKGAYKNENSR